MAIEPNRPESVGRVLDIAFQMYRAAVIRVLPLSLLAACGDVPYTLSWLQIYAPLRNGNNPRAAMQVFLQGAVSGEFAIIVTLTMIIKIWLVTALMLKVNAIASDSELEIAGALRQAVRPAASMLVATILYGLAMILAVLVATIVVGLAAASGSVLVSFVLGLLGSIPLLLFAISLSFAGPMVLFAAKGPFGALAASHWLVMGAWWRTTLIMTVGSVVLLVIYVPAASILTVMYRMFPQWQLLRGATTLGIGVVVSLLLTPFAVSLLLATFRELQLRKQGGDLLGRVAALV